PLAGPGRRQGRCDREDVPARRAQPFRAVVTVTVRAWRHLDRRLLLADRAVHEFELAHDKPPSTPHRETTTSKWHAPLTFPNRRAERPCDDEGRCQHQKPPTRRRGP